MMHAETAIPSNAEGRSPISTAAPAKTRAQAIRDSVEIRLAMGKDAGALIAEILAESGIEFPGVDWSGPLPSWLLACTVDGEAIGCCQVLVSKPVGFVEFLFVRKSVPFKLRAIAIRKLIIQSMATLHVAGCNYVGGVVATKNYKFANVLEKLHFVKTYSADMHIKRLS